MALQRALKTWTESQVYWITCENIRSYQKEHLQVGWAAADSRLTQVTSVNPFYTCMFGINTPVLTLGALISVLFFILTAANVPFQKGKGRGRH